MKAWFQGKSPREQALLTGFVFVAALVWLMPALGRMQASWGDYRAARQDKSAQQLWLDQQPTIESRAAETVRNLDPKQTLDATRLNSAVAALASGAGLVPQIDPARTEETAQFAHHTVRVVIRRASLTALLAFYDELAKKTPYLNLESISVQTERSAPGMLNVTLHVSATQIVR